MQSVTSVIRSTAKKPTNITLSSNVLEEAKSIGINISQACESHLRELIRLKKEERWLQEHQQFVSGYNQTVHDEGLPLDEWKGF
jgi:antitoxin CcdA